MMTRRERRKFRAGALPGVYVLEPLARTRCTSFRTAYGARMALRRAGHSKSYIRRWASDARKVPF